MIKIYVEKSFTFKNIDGQKTTFEKGFHEVEKAVYEHWFVKENCVMASDAPKSDDSEISDLKAQVEAKDAEVNDLKSQFEVKDKEISDLKAQVSDLTKKLEKVKKDVEKQNTTNAKPD